MARAYENDLRIRVVTRAKEYQESYQKIADIFDIGIATLKRWIKLYNESGSIESKIPTSTRPRKVNYKKVQKFIEKNPDKTLKEVGEQFKVKDTAILYITKKLNITYKKTLPIRGEKGRFTRRLSKDSKSNSKRKSYLSSMRADLI